MKKETITLPFKTYAFPLHVLLAYVVVFPWAFALVLGFFLNPTYFLESGLIIVIIPIVVLFSSLIVGGFITLFFSRLEINEEAVFINPPINRLTRFRRFPLYLYYDEIKIDTRWNGRILIIARGNQLDWMKRTAWWTILLGGFWLMPIRWRESLELIEKFQKQIKPKSEGEVDDGRWKLYASQLKENSST